MFNEIIKEVEKRIKGKNLQVKLALAAFLAKGHILLEDIPGVGKTTLAKTLSEVLGLEFNRIQFTSDLLPSDIIGVNYFDTNSSKFIFKEGPIFTEFLLADEINRTTPKTQSALLESMEESQVTIDGKARKLPNDFFVIATQNPLEEMGTFGLPHSQVDRFMISLSLGYPDKDSEKRILLNMHLEDVKSFSKEEIDTIRDSIEDVKVNENLVNYLLNIITYTRESGLFEYGISTRGGIALLKIAKAWAVIHNRDYVIDDDIVEVLPYVINHRLKPKNSEIDAVNEIFKFVNKYQ
jgi:MoxR-like ATPase